MNFETNDIPVGGTTAHLWHGGDGYPVLMMHGAGPGTSAMANFGKVRDPLAERYHVYATDMIGFGLSGRKESAPYFDYQLWLDQMQTVLDEIPAGAVRRLHRAVYAGIYLSHHRVQRRASQADGVDVSNPRRSPRIVEYRGDP